MGYSLHEDCQKDIGTLPKYSQWANTSGYPCHKVCYGDCPGPAARRTCATKVALPPETLATVFEDHPPKNQQSWMVNQCCGHARRCCPHAATSFSEVQMEPLHLANCTTPASHKYYKQRPHTLRCKWNHRGNLKQALWNYYGNLKQAL